MCFCKQNIKQRQKYNIFWNLQNFCNKYIYISQIQDFNFNFFDASLFLVRCFASNSLILNHTIEHTTKVQRRRNEGRGEGGKIGLETIYSG